MKIKNVVFDIGNVLVKWVPLEVIEKNFPEVNPKEFFLTARPIWLDLNLGKMAEDDAVPKYSVLFNVKEERIAKLLLELKISQTPIDGMFDLLEKLHNQGVPLYSITDNVREIINYHKANSGFIHHFEGVVASCDIGIMKPNSAIYQHLLSKYNLINKETVFFDDMQCNVDAAKAIGMQAFIFTNANECEMQLKDLGLLNECDHSLYV